MEEERWVVTRLNQKVEPLVIANVTISRDVIIEGFNDSLPARTYTGTLMNILIISHPADGSGTSIGNLSFSLGTSNLTWVRPDGTSVWNDTSAVWDFPDEYTIPENQNQGVEVATSIPSPQMMNAEPEPVVQPDPVQRHRLPAGQR